MTTQDPTIPPPPPSATTGQSDHDEHEIDLGEPDEEQVLDRGTLPEGLEYLGQYPTVQAYLRAQLEPEIARGCTWLLDHLDWRAVQRRFEEDGSRIFAESGHVYKV